MSASRLLSVRLAVAVAVVCAALILAFGIRQETPVGTLKGRAVARETGAPLQADVYLTPVAEADDQHLRYELAYNTTCGKDGSFVLRGVSAGNYVLEMQSKAHSLNRTRVSIIEGRTQTIEAQLEPAGPSLDLHINEHVFTPGESPRIVCSGFLDSDTLDVRLYKVDLNAFLIGSGGRLGKMLGSPYDYYMDEQMRSRLDLSANKALTLARSLRVPIDTRDIEDVFTQRVTLPSLAPGFYIVAVKAAGLQRLGWVMVSSLGLVAKTAGNRTLVYAVDLKSGAPVPSAAVNVYAEAKLVASGKTDSNGLLNLNLPGDLRDQPTETIIARSGDSFAFITAYIESTPSSRKTVYSYTERPIYRPGQTVFYKGIVRGGTGPAYKTPAPEPVTVEVYDPSDTLIYRAARKTNRFGSYSGSLRLDSETPTGYYSVRTRVGGDTQSTGFSVSAYRKPEFSTKVTFDRRRYVRGDLVTAKVSANYYFGSPVANARVHYYVERSSYWLFDEEGYGATETEGYSDYGGYGEQQIYGDLETDKNGEVTITFPATWPQPSEGEGYDTDQEFHVAVTVTDKSDREATGEAAIVATRGEFDIDVQTDSYIVRPGSKVGVTVTAKDYDRHPVKRQGITLTLARETWSEDGEVTTTTLAEKDVTTDGAGRAWTQLPATKTGSLRIAASSRDARGNTILCSSYLYSCTETRCDYDFGPVGGVEIVADKREYAPGDTAKLLILARRPGGTALVTVEGDSIYDVKAVPLKGKSTMVSFPVKADYGPNFYIVVSYLRDKQVETQQQEARVSMKSRELRVSITPGKKRYKPGEVASYTVKATDSQGKPASAELSMGVVDEAIYAIQEDSTPPILDYFYARRPNRVSTYDSIPRIYLSDPDKAGVPLKDSPVKIRVRKRFLDTAYWNPTIVTDSNGEARVSFRLPDNLTTWRATVRGITANTMCGQAKNTVISRQDMLVRLEMPRFLVQRDETTLTAVVHNYTGKGQRVRVRLRAPGLHIEDRIERTVFVANDGAERIDWTVTAPKPGTFSVDVRAVGETAGDEVLLDLPVKPHGPQTVTATSAVLSDSGQATQTVYVRRDSIPETTRLKVTLAPSLASAMFGSLDYLAQYPYGCTEQTVSSFLPDVILFRSLSAAGMPKIERQAELPAMVHKGLAKLYAFQLDEGGWSWCMYGEADPWMTAYVCYALVQARQAGFAVKQDVVANGCRELSNLVGSRKTDVYSRAFGAYVLALAGQNSTPVLDSVAARRSLPSQAIAALALGYQALGQGNRARAMLERLFAHSISGGNTIYWKGTNRYDGGDVEPTALALQAVLKINPSDPRVYAIVRWLMSQWRDEYWASTRATAMALYAMSEFVRISHELSPDFSAVVLVNGKQAGKARFGRASIYQPQVTITVPGADLRKGRNELKIVKVGPGNLYYSTNLTQSLDQESMPAILSSAGLTVTREYFRPSSRYFQTDSGGDLGNPVDRCSVGDTVLVRLTIRSTSRLSHMMLEDNIPAGCEIISQGNVSFYEWYNWWVGQDVRDDKISFYLDEVSRGKHVVEYQMRGGFAGAYCALPAQVFSMYDPDVRATTEAAEFTVR